MAGAPRPGPIPIQVSDLPEPKLLPTLIGEIGRRHRTGPFIQVNSCILSENGQATPMVQVVVFFPKEEKRRDEWLLVPYHSGSLIRVRQRPQRTQGDSFLASSVELVQNHRIAAAMVIAGFTLNDEKVKGWPEKLAQMIDQAAVNAVRASILSTVSRDGHCVSREELVSAWGNSIAKDVMES